MASYEGVLADDVAVTVTDNDSPGVSVSPTALPVGEGASGTYTVVLATQPSALVTVTVGVPAGTDVSVRPSSVTFTTGNWSTARTVTVTAADDDDAAGDEVTLSHSVASSDTDYNNAPADPVVVTVADDDTAAVSVSPASLTVIEGDASGDSYSVVLDTEPSALVTVTVSGHSGSDVSVSPTRLTFTTGNWSTAQSVTVTAADDDDAAGEEVTLSHSASSDSDYNNASADDVVVTVVDDDSVPSAPSGLAASRGAGSGEVDLVWVPGDDGGLAVSGYQYQHKVGAGAWGSAWFDIAHAAVGVGVEVGGTVTGLADGTEYTFRVAAVNSIGAGAASGEASATPATVPGKPGGLDATPADTVVELKWDPPGNGGAAIVRHEYRFRTVGAYGEWVEIDDSAAGQYNWGGYLVENLTNAVVHAFQVRTVNDVGAGEASDEISAVPYTVPDAPGSLTAQALAGSVRLRWTVPAGNGSAITKHQYRFRTDGGHGDWEDIDDSGAGGDNEDGYTVAGARQRGGSHLRGAGRPTRPAPARRPMRPPPRRWRRRCRSRRRR